MTRLNYLVYPEGYILDEPFSFQDKQDNSVTLDLTMQSVNTGSLSGMLCVLGSLFPWKVNSKSTRDRVLVKWSSALGMSTNYSRRVSGR